jgi:hypothetical protein
VIAETSWYSRLRMSLCQPVDWRSDIGIDRLHVQRCALGDPAIVLRPPPESRGNAYDFAEDFV